MTIVRELLMVESGAIKTQMGNHNTPIVVAMYGTPCAILLRKQ